MHRQAVLDPKSWAERTLGGVSLHGSLSHPTRGPSGHPSGGASARFFARSTAPLESDQSLVSMARRGRCPLCGVAAAARSADQSPRHGCSCELVGAGYHRQGAVASAQKQRRGPDRP